jgi:hypothetical protein
MSNGELTESRRPSAIAAFAFRRMSWRRLHLPSERGRSDDRVRRSPTAPRFSRPEGGFRLATGGFAEALQRVTGGAWSDAASASATIVFTLF